MFIAEGAMARTNRLSLSSMWPSLVILMATAVLTGGMLGATTNLAAGEYTFSAEAGVDDGRYFRLGEEGDSLLLGTCRLERDYMVVKKSAVRNVVVQASRRDVGPSLFGIIFKDARVRPLGTQFPCT